MLIAKLFFLVTFLENVNCVLLPRYWGIQKRGADLSTLNSPYLANCLPDRDAAKNQTFTPKHGFFLTPVTGGAVGDKYKYKFKYSALRWPEFDDILTKPGKTFDISNYKNRRGMFYFDKKTILPGLYQVTMQSFVIQIPRGNKVKSFAPVTCYFAVKALPPLIVLHGGIYRQMPPKQEIILDAKETIDMNQLQKQDEIRTLAFAWRCQNTTTKGVCSHPVMSTDTMAKIPIDEVVANRTFNIILDVANYGRLSTIIQEIEIVPGAVGLLIRCIKNCPPVTDSSDHRKMTYFRAECEKNCDSLKEEELEWEVTSASDPDFKIDYDTQTYYGRIGQKFKISEDALKPDNEYLVTLQLTNNRPGKTTMKVKYALLPEIQSCEVQPPSGKSMETYFKLSCNPAGDPDDLFEIFVDGNLRDGVIGGYPPDVFKYEFLLPPSRGHRFSVRVTKTDGGAVDIDLKVTVESTVITKPSTAIKAIYERFSSENNGPSVSSLLKSKKPLEKEEGIRAFKILVDEIVSNEPNKETFEFAKNITYTAVQDILVSPPCETVNLVTLSEAIAKIIVHNELTDSDPYLAKLATSVCKLMIMSHAEDVKNAKFPLNSETQFNTVGRILTKCMEANVRENFAVLSRSEYKIIVNTLEPDTQLVKDYPSYVEFEDDDDYSEHLENYNALTKNIFTSHLLQAKSLALTTKVGSHFARSAGNFSGILVAKNTGEKLANTRIEFMNSVLIPSADFENSTHEFDLLMIHWAKDLLWWNHPKTRVITDVVSIQFWHGKCEKRIRNFKNPVVMLLDVKNTTNFDVFSVTSSVAVPENFSSLSGDKLNPYIHVHRIDIPRGAVLHIQFYNISPYDEFEAVITKFEFPTIKNFADNRTVGKHRKLNHMRIINYEKHGIWGYLGLLPSKTSLVKESGLMHYDVTFVTSFCLIWDILKRCWKPDCKSGLASSSRTISCECRHFSTIAGYSQNVKSVVQEVITEEVELKLEVCYIVFITMAVTFGIFCLLVIPIAFKKLDPVYFLADNKKSETYAYLITVRTEDKHNAGTTSNVMIKLFGSKGISDPHVLNYPDPKMYLLQRQAEDMFVLTTKDKLGNIEKIELWSDCSGPSTSWGCRDIVVFDLQNNEQWYFKIKAEFEIRTGVTHLTTTPYDSLESKKTHSKFRICNHFHTWQLWAAERNFPFLARLTVVFSNILFMYTLNLVMQGLPMFEPRDCFDISYSLTVPASAIVTCLMCSFLSFIPHIILAWTFRFSNIEFYAFRRKFKQAYDLSGCCWVILVITIFASSSVLVFHGFWLPKYRSLLWLITSWIAIAFDVLILENVFIIVQTFICKFKLTLSIDKKRSRYLKMIETQREILYKTFDSEILRPYLSHLYRPLQKVQLIRRKIIVQLRQGIYNDLEDIFMYGIYNILLYLVILLNRSTLTTTCREEIKTLINGEYTRTLGFSDLGNVKQVYEYINQTLIPVTQPMAWYEKYPITDPGLMVDITNKYLGVVRLRQHRIAQRSCVVPDLMKFLNVTCSPEFEMSNAEFGVFGPQWGPFKETFEYDKFKSKWHYLDEQDTETGFVAGRLGYYSGGGYVAYLGRALTISMGDLRKLAKSSWLDRQTRAVFLEFLIYNVNYNVFVGVNLQFEQSASGYSIKYADINVVRMLFVENEMELVTIVMFVLYIFWVAMLMLKLAIGIAKNVTDFYKKTWLMIDVLINSMTIVNVTAFIVRIKMIDQYLDTLDRANNKEFVSYSDLFMLEELMTYFGGILVCVATVRLWKFLRFGMFFRILERTLTMAAFPLFSVTFAFAVILTAFGLSGVLIYGDEHPELSTFIRIVATLIQLSLKPDQFDLTAYLHVKLAYFYFASYLMLMQIILLVYITVIIMAYMKAQLELSVQPDSYTVTDYIRERLDYLPRLLRTKLHRLRGGEQEYSPITPKADEFRYANCLGIQQSRVESMRFIVCCIVRNINQTSEEKTELTEYEIDLMMRVCKSFVLKTFIDDDFDLFFKGHLIGERVRLVDEKRIDKCAKFVQAMFRRRTQESRLNLDQKIAHCCQISLEKINGLQSAGLRLKLIVIRLSNIEEVVNNLFDAEINPIQ